MLPALFSSINWQVFAVAALIGDIRRIGDRFVAIHANDLTSNAGRSHE
jgi:hypothetical protein